MSLTALPDRHSEIRDIIDDMEKQQQHEQQKQQQKLKELNLKRQLENMKYSRIIQRINSNIEPVLDDHIKIIETPPETSFGPEMDFSREYTPEVRGQARITVIGSLKSGKSMLINTLHNVLRNIVPGADIVEVIVQSIVHDASKRSIPGSCFRACSRYNRTEVNSFLDTETSDGTQRCRVYSITSQVNRPFTPTESVKLQNHHFLITDTPSLDKCVVELCRDPRISSSVLCVVIDAGDNESLDTFQNNIDHLIQCNILSLFRVHYGYDLLFVVNRSPIVYTQGLMVDGISADISFIDFLATERIRAKITSILIEKFSDVLVPIGEHNVFFIDSKPLIFVLNGCIIDCPDHNTVDDNNRCGTIAKRTIKRALGVRSICSWFDTVRETRRLFHYVALLYRNNFNRYRFAYKSDLLTEFNVPFLADTLLRGSDVKVYSVRTYIVRQVCGYLRILYNALVYTNVEKNHDFMRLQVLRTLNNTEALYNRACKLCRIHEIVLYFWHSAPKSDKLCLQHEVNRIHSDTFFYHFFMNECSFVRYLYNSHLKNNETSVPNFDSIKTTFSIFCSLCDNINDMKYIIHKTPVITIDRKNVLRKIIEPTICTKIGLTSVHLVICGDDVYDLAMKIHAKVDSILNDTSSLHVTELPYKLCPPRPIQSSILRLFYTKSLMFYDEITDLKYKEVSKYLDHTIVWTCPQDSFDSLDKLIASDNPYAVLVSSADDKKVCTFIEQLKDRRMPEDCIYKEVDSFIEQWLYLEATHNVSLCYEIVENI